MFNTSSFLPRPPVKPFKPKRKTTTPPVPKLSSQPLTIDTPTSSNTPLQQQSGLTDTQPVDQLLVEDI